MPATSPSIMRAQGWRTNWHEVCICLHTAFAISMSNPLSLPFLSTSLNGGYSPSTAIFRAGPVAAAGRTSATPSARVAANRPTRTRRFKSACRMCLHPHDGRAFSRPSRLYRVEDGATSATLGPQDRRAWAEPRATVVSLAAARSGACPRPQARQVALRSHQSALDRIAWNRRRPVTRRPGRAPDRASAYPPLLEASRPRPRPPSGGLLP